MSSTVDENQFIHRSDNGTTELRPKGVRMSSSVENSTRLLTLREAARFLTCSTSHVRKLVDRGLLRRVEMGHRCKRFLVSELERYINSLSGSIEDAKPKKSKRRS